MDIFSLLGNIGKAVFNAALSAGSNDSDDDWDDKDCDWFCDNCGEFMNDQPGFNTVSGTWVCQNCGEVNDVSEDNIHWEGEADYDPEYDE